MGRLSMTCPTREPSYPLTRHVHCGPLNFVRLNVGGRSVGSIAPQIYTVNLVV